MYSGGGARNVELAGRQSDLERLELRPAALAAEDTLFEAFDFSSCVQTVATTEHTAAAAQSSCHAGAVSANDAFSQVANPCPPTAGPVVNTAAQRRRR